jgi:antitoxin HigA-1
VGQQYEQLPNWEAVHRSLVRGIDIYSGMRYNFLWRKAMPTKLKSPTTIENRSGRRLPAHRPPTHPGEMILEEFLKPLDLTQAELARRLGVSYPRLNEIVKGRRSVTPDTALRLSRVLGMSPDFWLGLQQDWDLWHAMRSPEAREILQLKPILVNEQHVA